jgi:long-chain fatty acid transport protein
MKPASKILAMLALTLLLAAPPTWATNGNNLIAVGPIARAMGGVGVAAPQDAIGAVFANPAAMCFGPYCPSSEINFAGTAFMPKVSTRIQSPIFGTVQADSDEKVYAIPAFGLSLPIGSGPSNWRFGLSAYGVTGLGVDYRGTQVDNNNYFGPGFPASSAAYTQQQIMKFAPAVAWQPSSNWSVGVAVHVDYASLDLRNGTSPGYSYGIQPGVIFKATDNLSLGANYISPQSVTHENVSDFDQDGTFDSLELEAPQQFSVGAAYTLLDGRLLLEGDAKWINWSNAAGYSDFDWEDQWVFAIGGQFEVVENLYLRAGYNFGENPVKEHNGWAQGGLTTVQGKTLPTYYYETFRVVGFPAIVESHYTCGIGYSFTENLKLDLGFMYAPKTTITQTGGGPAPGTGNFTMESELSETSLDFGLTWRF